MTGGRSTDAVYLDSSVLVALLAVGDAQHGPALRLARAHPGPMVSSALTEIEIGRALARRSAPRPVQRAARELLYRCNLVDLTPEIRVIAIEVRPASLRSLDAIHIATALVAGLRVFASFDGRQRLAAEEMGLELVAGI